MAPQKRARPSFSPPRPGRSKAKPVTKSNDSSITALKKHKKNTVVSEKSSRSKQPASDIRQRSRLVSPTPSASDSLGGDDTSDTNSNDENDNSRDMRDEAQSSDAESEIDHEDQRAPASSSPEPDYILAEISHLSPKATGNNSDTNSILPLDLVHHILQSHFSKPDETKMSQDARKVVAKYIEVFVREAIMRCAYEKTEIEKGGTRTDTGGDGWLEVDTLEKVAVQLCLDF